ncbi:MAG: hypothetical protein WBC70_00265 [Candidatus Aminicenantales bacterium]
MGNPFSKKLVGEEDNDAPEGCQGSEKGGLILKKSRTPFDSGAQTPDEFSPEEGPAPGSLSDFSLP